MFHARIAGGGGLAGEPIQNCPRARIGCAGPPESRPGRSASIWRPATVSCISMCTPSTRCSTAPRGSTSCSKTAQEMGMPAIATTDHGYVFGAYEFWKTATKYGIKPIIGVEAYLTPRTHRSDRNRVKWADATGRDDVSGSGAYTHMTLLAKNTSGMHNLFRMTLAGQPRGLLTSSPGWTATCCSTYGQGLIATTGCPSGEVQTRLRLGQYKRGASRPPPSSATSSARELLLRADGPWPRHRAQRPGRPAAARQGPRPAAGRDQRPALHQARGRDRARRAAVRPVRLDAGRPEPVQVRRRRLLPQDRGRDARGLARASRGV